MAKPNSQKSTPRHPLTFRHSSSLLAALALLVPSAPTQADPSDRGLGGRGGVHLDNREKRNQSTQRTPLNGKKWNPIHYSVPLHKLIEDPEEHINRINRGKLFVSAHTALELERKRIGWVGDYKGHRLVFNDAAKAYHEKALKLGITPVMKTRIHKTGDGYSYHFTRGYLPQDSPPLR